MALVLLAGTVFTYLTSSVLANPIVTKTDLVNQASEARVESTYYVISDASAGDEYTEWCIIPMDSDLDKRDDAEEDGKPSPTSSTDARNASLVADIVNYETPPNKVKRHSWAMICYNMNPDNRSGGGQPQVSLTHRCRYEKGCLTDWLGTLSKKVQDSNCDLLCRCKNLGYRTSCIHQAVAPWINCLKVRAAEIQDGDESYLQVRSVEGSDDTTSHAWDLVKRGSDQVERRHNWAFVCYDINPVKNPKTADYDAQFRSFCVQSYGYSCDAKGKTTFNKQSEYCDEYCNCQDLFPKSKWGAICFDVNGGVKKCVKARDLDISSLLSMVDGHEADHIKQDSEVIEKRHNWALVCYDSNPDRTSKAAFDAVFRNLCVQSYGYSCDGKGKLTFKQRMNFCDEDCQCQDLFPKSKWGAVCFDVSGGNKKCVKARGLDISSLPSAAHDAASTHRSMVESLGSFDSRADAESLAKRHNWALVCYKVNQSAFPDIAELDSKRRDDCVRKNGYSCTKTGQLEADKNDSVCNLYCRCKNLYANLGSCAINLLVGDVKKCVSRREDHLVDADSGEILASLNDVLLLDKTFNASEIEFIPVLDLAVLNDQDVDDSLSRRDGLEKRHNWALSCYTLDKDTLETIHDTATGRKCLSKGYSCDAQGYKTHMNSDIDCDSRCKCEDLYPRSKLWAACAIKAVVGSTVRCLTRREYSAHTTMGDTLESAIDAMVLVDDDFDLAAWSGATGLTTTEADSLIKRHNWAFSCYNTNPDYSGVEAKIDMSMYNRCRNPPYQYGCDNWGTVRFVQAKPECTNLCRCTDLFPLPRPCIKVSYIQDCLKPRDAAIDASNTEIVDAVREAGGNQHSSSDADALVELQVSTTERHGYGGLPKLQRRDDAIQQNATFAQNVSIAQNVSMAQNTTVSHELPIVPGYVLSCQDPLMTLRCLFEVGGYTCTGKGPYSEWSKDASAVRGVALWLQPDWRTCNCLCTCFLAIHQRDVSYSHLSPPTSKDVMDRVYAFENATTSLDQAVDHKRSTSTEQGSTNVQLESKRTDTIDGGAPLPSEAGQEADAKQNSAGRYAINCGELTHECANIDLMSCSAKGVLYAKNKDSVDEACAVHCRCEWETAQGKRSDALPLPPLFDHDAVFKQTRHARRWLTPRQGPITDKKSECDALVHGVESWTLMCQEHPPDYFSLTSECYNDAGFWCPEKGPTVHWPNTQPGTYRTIKCRDNCICYKRYDPAKRDLMALDGGEDAGTAKNKQKRGSTPPSNSWLETMGQTTMITATVAGK